MLIYLLIIYYIIFYIIYLVVHISHINFYESIHSIILTKNFL